jgi:hypothetical protein
MAPYDGGDEFANPHITTTPPSGDKPDPLENVPARLRPGKPPQKEAA